MTTPTAPKYRTTTQACSCPGFWYRRSCRHIIAYREAVALVLAQDVFNQAWSPIPDKLSGMGRWVRGPLPGRESRAPGNGGGSFRCKRGFL